jgi:uncharacterized protein YndB with AHSA1/START domain
LSWEQTAVVRAEVSAARVWAVLLDGRRWARWNPGVEWMLVEGELEPGTVVTTKPTGAPQTALRIEEVEPPRRLTLLLTIGPLAALRLRWELCEREGTTEIGQTVATSGPLAGPLLGRAAVRIAGGMSANLERLAALAVSAPEA